MLLSFDDMQRIIEWLKNWGKSQRRYFIMKRTKQLLSLILAFTITIISCSVNVKAAEPAQKTSIDGMDAYISINDDGYAVLDSSAALNAGYTDQDD